MKKLYLVTNENELREPEIIAETEFHWTIMYLSNNLPITIHKGVKNSSFRSTEEEAWDFRINTLKKNATYYKKIFEHSVDTLRTAEEAQKKYFEGEQR